MKTGTKMLRVLSISTITVMMGLLISGLTGTGLAAFQISIPETTADITDTTDKRYVTDSEKASITNTDAHINSTDNPHLIDATDVLPDQTGNNGKYLTTNGSTLSWGTVTGGSGGGQYPYIATVDDSGADYTSIQAAINAVSTAGGGTVLIREGTYNETISMESDVTIVGSGIGHTIIRQPDNSNIDTVSVSNKNNWKIANLSIDGNRSNNTTGDNGIVINGGQYWVIENVESYENRLKGFVIASDTAATKYGKFLNFIAHDNGQDGLAVAAGVSYDCTDIDIIGGYAYDNTQYGIGIITPTENYRKAKNILITGNHVYDNGTYGIEVKGGVTPLINNNFVYNNGYHGIDLGLHTNAQFKVTGGVVSNNVSYNNSQAMLGYSGINKQHTEQMLVEGNVVYDDQGSATQKGITDSGNNANTTTVNNKTWGNRP